MKHLKKYEMWTTNSTSNFSVNYGDKQPELSEIVIEIIKYIEDNYDNISNDILNNTTEFGVGFNFGRKDGKKYNSIKINKYKNNSYVDITYYDVHNQINGYSLDITDYDYDYLHKYFLNLYKNFKKKNEEKDKEKHKLELKKIEDEKIKKSADKYNL